ncbi:Uncharacterised protein [uncultured archaeon]|nr:Uncharacterised protein [uncultured archaeon]
MPPETNGYPTNGDNGNDPVGSWAMWQRLVLSELKQAKADITELYKEIGDLKIKMAVVQTRAALIGAIVGVLSSAFLGALFTWIFTSMGNVKLTH